MKSIEQKLQELGIEIPSPSAPVANYVSYVKTGSLIFIAGQISMTEDGTIHTGRVGEGLTVEQGQIAARLCGLRILSQIKEACEGDLPSDATRRHSFSTPTIRPASGLLLHFLYTASRRLRAMVYKEVLRSGLAIQ